MINDAKEKCAQLRSEIVVVLSKLKNLNQDQPAV
jgi:hypothetical protein